MAVSHLLRLLLSCCFVVGVCAATEYWVRPDSTRTCNTRQPCLSLSEYVQNTSHYFMSNSVFHFLPGNHSVGETTWVVIQDVANISLVGSTGHATVKCIGKVGFAFRNVVGLKVLKIQFFGCGSEVTGHLRCDIQGTWNLLEPPSFQLSTVHVALLFVECSTVLLESIKVMNSCGYGLLGWNMMEVELNYCQLHHNNWRMQNSSFSSTQSDNRRGGNALFVFNKDAHVKSLMHKNHTRSLSLLTILHSEFAHGRNLLPDGPYMQKEFAHGAGLGIYIRSLISLASFEFQFISVYNCSMHNNTSLSTGANMFLYTYESNPPLQLRVNIDSCKFYGGNSSSEGGGFAAFGGVQSTIINSKFRHNFAPRGGGLFLKSGSNLMVLVIQQCICHGNTGMNGSGIYITNFRVSISNTEFVENIATVAGGAMFVKWLHSRPTLGDIDLYNSTFIHNSAHSFGTALHFSVDTLQNVFHATLVSVTFHRNYMLAQEDCAVLYLYATMNITIINSIFSDNNCTCISANRSIFHFHGTVGFYRNRGYSGGAIAFVQNESQLKLIPHTTVYIVNNTAMQYGGGILADDDCTAVSYCFFQISNEYLGLSSTQLDVRFIMEGNRAGRAGDSIFGGCLKSCFLYSPPPQHKLFLTAKLFHSLFQIHGQTQSEVAATPWRVCFCEQQFKFSTGYQYECLSEISVAHFRGETFLILAMIVGEYGYASSALVRTRIAPLDSGELGDRQTIQEVGKICTNLTYSVGTAQESIKLILSVESLMGNKMPLSSLKVTMRPCPFGFNLSDNPPKCDCALHLRKPGVECNINTQLIHRPALVWIGNYSNEVVVHTNCPFDYCKPEDNDISLYEQDQQCAFNRSGILCGACLSGLSLTLGTSKCMACSNTYILLFIPFALAGVALIILMLKCNLTVSTGTLNGLIFYANIVQANHAVFFPLGKLDAFSSFLSVFIAWLNLDLGVEVCFFKGLDAYIRTWLQFVFPIYIWILVGLMIFSSRYSIVIARLSGSNTVSVLATLFLLSYAKLLQTIIAAISFTTLTDSNEKTSAVWLLDGNIPVMNTAHIPLVLMSILTLVIYVVPFTVLVLLSPCLQARSGHRLLRWVNKIKPLLDAYQGPYRDKFRYWTGLLLWVRIVLFVIFGGNALGDPRVNLFAITAVVVTLLVLWLNVGKVYKKLSMKLLESFFLLNLIIFAAATLFLKSLEGFSVVEKQAVLTSIMVGSAFVVFIGILACHCYQELAKSNIFGHLCGSCVAFFANANHRRGSGENGGESISDGSTAATHQPPTVSTVAMDELREPLLTDN